MPKRELAMSFGAAPGQIRSFAMVGDRHSTLEARPLGRGRLLPALVAPWLPRITWPIRCPGGSLVRGIVRRTPRLQLARVTRGQLALPERWLPNPTPLSPLGLYAPRLELRLLPPTEGAKHGAC